jgi:hypothetical protein
LLIVLKSGSLNLLEPSAPVKACNGIALPLPLYRVCLSNDAALVLTFHTLENIIVKGELRGRSPLVYIAIEYVAYVKYFSAQVH